MRTLSHVGDWGLLLVASYGRKQRTASSLVTLIWTLIPLMIGITLMSSCDPDFLSKSPPPNSNTLGVKGFNTRMGGNQIFSLLTIFLLQFKKLFYLIMPLPLCHPATAGFLFMCTPPHTHHNRLRGHIPRKNAT